MSQAGYVVRGNPSPEELAAVITVVSARAAAAAARTADRGPVSLWAAPAGRMRRMPHPGPGAWRASAWPV